MTLSLLCSLLYPCAAVLIWKSSLRSRRPLRKAVLPAFFFAAFLLRIWLALTQNGYPQDMSTFKAWAQLTHIHGLSGMYHADFFLDYPPGYLYVLYFLEQLRLWFGLSSQDAVWNLILKLPSILADLLCAYLLYRVAQNRIRSVDAALLCGAYLFCPAILINSSVWGQVDSFCLLFVFCALLFLLQKKIFPCAAVYAVAVLLKPQALFYAPLFVLFLLRKKRYRWIFRGIAAFFLSVLLIALPFTEHFDYLTLLRQYLATLQSYSYFSINAYNLYALFGLNWGSIETAIPSAFCRGLLTVLPIVLVVLYSGWIYWRAPNRGGFFFCAYFLTAGTFLLSVKMHERYLFPALLFLLLSFVFWKDLRLLFSFLGLSFTHFLNVAYVLHLNNTSVSAFHLPMLLLSAAQTAVILYTGKLAWDLCIRKKAPVSKLQISFPKKTLPAGADGCRRLTTKDLFPLLALTFGSALLLFWNLGSFQSAQTSWIPAEGESVVLETSGRADKLLYLPGIGADGRQNTCAGVSLRMELSMDGVFWQSWDDLTEGEVYAWESIPLSAEFRYLRLTAYGTTVLNEFALKADGEDRLLTLTPVAGNAAALLDEQDAVPLYPTWYDSMYFDEIYHARTAYEHLHGIWPYETTHPPLGKLLIALGIARFGMTPFGWRFSGALFGVLMLPAFYILLKRLFGKTGLAACGTCLFAVDFMHYTQSRIATIDTYAVFFLILMYGCMAVFLDTDLKTATLRQICLPLFFCGVSFGLGAAAKWTALYGGLGLAFLFFYRLFRTANQTPKAERPALLRRYRALILWCCLFFLIIPACLYSAAYLPVFTVTGHSYREFFSYQAKMYSYHATLDATHTFSSAWYEWPILKRPVWYHITWAENTADGLTHSISALGNPIIWWGSIATMLLSAVWGLLYRDRRAAFLWVGYLSVYLPWVGVTRIAFLYHYYTAVPFLILSMVWVPSFAHQQIRQKPKSQKALSLQQAAVQAATWLLPAAALGLFILFFPVISGAGVPLSTLQSLEWFSSWYFG